MYKRLIGIIILMMAIAGVSFAQSNDEATFPIVIEHKFGTTTITEQPQRIVAIGYTEQDFLLALGEKPVAVRYWYGETPHSIYEWALDEAGEGYTPEVLNMPFGNLNYEAILALQPDFISAVTSGISQEEYDILSQIAPTLPQSDDYINFGMPWQETTRMIGTALGKADEAEALVSRVQGLFDEAQAQNPEFIGKTVAVAYNYGESHIYGYYTEQDARGRFFTDLGFVIPDELNDIAGENFYTDISNERIDLLNQDVLVFLGLGFSEIGQEGILADPLVSQLQVIQEGRVVFIPAEYDDALQFSTVLSLEYALEGIVPELQTALGIASAEANICEAGFMLISHDKGDTCIPNDVQRVVALEWSYVEDLLALGIMPIGVADIEGYKNWVKIEPQLDETVVDVGTRQEPNLEVLAGLQPDLIIGASFRMTENYDALNAIAPTIAFNAYPEAISHYDEMVNTFRTIGQMVNRPDEAEAVLSAMNAYFAQANQALTDAGRAGETFILSQTFLSSEVPTFRLFTDNALAVQVLEQIGLSNAWDDAPQQYGFTTVDFEAFVGIQDTNFFYIAQPDYQTTLIESPLWGGLPFVLSERAYWLGGDVWLFGGPLSMQVLTDTVLNAMGITIPQATAYSGQNTSPRYLKLFAVSSELS